MQAPPNTFGYNASQIGAIQSMNTGFKYENTTSAFPMGLPGPSVGSKNTVRLDAVALNVKQKLKPTSSSENPLPVAEDYICMGDRGLPPPNSRSPETATFGLKALRSLRNVNTILRDAFNKAYPLGGRDPQATRELLPQSPGVMMDSGVDPHPMLASEDEALLHPYWILWRFTYLGNGRAPPDQHGNIPLERAHICKIIPYVKKPSPVRDTIIVVLTRKSINDPYQFVPTTFIDQEAGPNAISLRMVPYSDGAMTGYFPAQWWIVGQFDASIETYHRYFRSQPADAKYHDPATAAGESKIVPTHIVRLGRAVGRGADVQYTGIV